MVERNFTTSVYSANIEGGRVAVGTNVQWVDCYFRESSFVFADDEVHLINCVLDSCTLGIGETWKGHLSGCLLTGVSDG